MSNSSTALEVNNITRIFAGYSGKSSVTAVSNITLSISKGLVFGLAGPNRAGKSTLIKICLGLLKPSTGSVSLFGNPVSHHGATGRSAAMLQGYSFPPYLNPWEILMCLGSISFVEETELQTRIELALNRVGLTDQMHNPVENFSLGMIQRLLMAQAMVKNADFLFLDEPSESLDLEGQRLLAGWILERKEAGKTTLLASHDHELLEGTCDQIGLLENGKLIASKASVEWTKHGRIPLSNAMRGDLQPTYLKDIQ